MCYKCVSNLYKVDKIDEGYLLEYLNNNTQKTEMYLVVKVTSKTSGKHFLVNKKGEAYSIDCVNKIDLSLNGLSLVRIYGNINFNLLTNKKTSHEIYDCKSIDLYSAQYRHCIYEKGFLYLTEKQALEMLAKNIDKNIVLV